MINQKNGENMTKLSSSSYISALMQAQNLNFKKHLGQNFLIDANITRAIVDRAGITDEDGVLEIGAGIGSLTEELVESAKKVVSVEIDDKLWQILEDNFRTADNFKLIKGDVLKQDLKALIAEEFVDCQRVLVVANLPYYITTPIIMTLLEQRLALESITVMIQKEVAERLSASPNSKAYGALTVSAQFYADVEMLFTVSSHCFMPKPAVDSAVIKLSLREHNLDLKSDEIFFKTVKAAFNQRRKTLINSLSHNLKIDKKVLREQLEKIDIDPKSRAENLSSADFGKLANMVVELE